jgi:hypothetical protein
MNVRAELEPYYANTLHHDRNKSTTHQRFFLNGRDFKSFSFGENLVPTCKNWRIKISPFQETPGVAAKTEEEQKKNIACFLIWY